MILWIKIGHLMLFVLITISMMSTMYYAFIDERITATVPPLVNLSFFVTIHIFYYIKFQDEIKVRRIPDTKPPQNCIKSKLHRSIIKDDGNLVKTANYLYDLMTLDLMQEKLEYERQMRLWKKYYEK